MSNPNDEVDEIIRRWYSDEILRYQGRVVAKEALAQAAKRSVKITSTSKYAANVSVDGRLIGRAVDCDGRWALIVDTSLPEHEDFDGAYPCDDAAGLGYAIRECVSNIGTVTVNGREV